MAWTNENRVHSTTMKRQLTLLAGLTALVLGSQVARAEDAPEKPKGPPHPVAKERILAKFDTNKDGALSKDELAAMPEPMRNRLLTNWDTNKDGELSKEEVEAIKPPEGGAAPERPHRPKKQEGEPK